MITDVGRPKARYVNNSNSLKQILTLTLIRISDIRSENRKLIFAYLKPQNTENWHWIWNIFLLANPIFIFTSITNNVSGSRWHEVPLCTSIVKFVVFSNKKLAYDRKVWRYQESIGQTMATMLLLYRQCQQCYSCYKSEDKP